MTTLASTLILKKAGIPQHYLTKYYNTCIRPKMSYGCAAWFPMASPNRTEQLSRLEKLILKIICPTGDDYQERLMNLGVVLITSFLVKSCSDYMLKIQKPEQMAWLENQNKHTSFNTRHTMTD